MDKKDDELLYGLTVQLAHVLKTYDRSEQTQLVSHYSPLLLLLLLH